MRVMKNMLDMVLDYDIAARKVVASANNEAKMIMDEANEKVAEITEKAAREAEEEIKRNESKYGRRNSEKTEAIRAHCETRIKNLEATFSQNKEKYISSVFSRITEI